MAPAISIEDLRLLKGYLPQRALSLVLEWADLHKKELMIDWNLAKGNQPLHEIEPLQ